MLAITTPIQVLKVRDNGGNTCGDNIVSHGDGYSKKAHSAAESDEYLSREPVF